MAEARYAIRTKTGRFVIKFAESKEDAIERFQKEKEKNLREEIVSVINLDKK